MTVPRCDDDHGRHLWAAGFTDGDTCACGRFYLDLHPGHGLAAELQETPRADPERTTRLTERIAPASAATTPEAA
jgi:hypothetical protein